MIIRMIWLGAGIAFFLAGAWLVSRKLRCNKEVVGKFVRWDSMVPKKEGGEFAPVFEFELGDEWYSSRSFESFSLKKTEGMFRTDHYYKIFVNEKKPKDFVIARKLYWEDYWVFVFSAFCLLMAFIPV